MRRDDSPCCELTVADTGVGIPPDELERVFEKFVQSSKTKNGAGGTGLGLAIFRMMARHWAEEPACRWSGSWLSTSSRSTIRQPIF